MAKNRIRTKVGLLVRWDKTNDNDQWSRERGFVHLYAHPMTIGRDVYEQVHVEAFPDVKYDTAAVPARTWCGWCRRWPNTPPFDKLIIVC